MKIKFTLATTTLLSLLIHLSASAQVGIGTITPDPNAMLDITSTQKGLLLPRLSSAQQATLTAMLTPSEAGMLVRDSASGKTIFWNGTAWADFATQTITAASPLSISSTNIVSLNPGTAAGDLITWDGLNWVNMQPATQHFNLTVSNLQPYATLNYCIALQGIFPSQNTPILSEIDLYSFNFPPKGWAFCNGQLLPISQNVAIFSLLGTTYGGNGINTFALPDLRSRIPLHMGTGSTGTPYVLGGTDGTEQNAISR